ncbi:rod shape-determining protein MreC [Caloramator quimbayensis]|uniref:Cell shape-determining protein MreC n=1 Tax=Caloramator quimbayensis TaxID=1147123 RepID=A0A1T4XZP9_9CLOT|nr:rod shape-determining protein MreC [Caloramator quimbayensis]SKA94531.1 rod shape-determining protein MreC [Caloramator quimbayensis]
MDFLKNKLLTIVLVLCLAFTIFVGITANKKDNTGIIQGAITSTITPVQKYIYIAGQRINNMVYYISSITSLRKENLRLNLEIQSLNKKLIEYERYKRENEELMSLLNLKNTHQNTKFTSANVIGKVGENWFDIIIIDVGEDDGIKKGQYVLASQGLVGQVIEVNKNTSKVLTILDEKSNIPGKVSSTGEDGMVVGEGNSLKEKMCKIDYLPLETKAKPGDLIVTSNIINNEDILIPSDIQIGTIIKIEEESNLMNTAYIKPSVDFSKLQKVMVVIK